MYQQQHQPYKNNNISTLNRTIRNPYQQLNNKNQYYDMRNNNNSLLDNKNHLDINLNINVNKNGEIQINSNQQKLSNLTNNAIMHPTNTRNIPTNIVNRPTNHVHQPMNPSHSHNAMHFAPPRPGDPHLCHTHPHPRQAFTSQPILRQPVYIYQQPIQLNTKMQQSPIFCVICNETYQQCDQQMHILKHRNRLDESKQQPVQSSALLQKYSTTTSSNSKKYTTRPIVEPQQYNVQYNPNSFKLQQIYNYNNDDKPQYQTIGIDTNQQHIDKIANENNQLYNQRNTNPNYMVPYDNQNQQPYQFRQSQQHVSYGKEGQKFNTNAPIKNQERITYNNEDRQTYNKSQLQQNNGSKSYYRQGQQDNKNKIYYDQKSDPNVLVYNNNQSGIQDKSSSLVSHQKQTFKEEEQQKRRSQLSNKPQQFNRQQSQLSHKQPEQRQTVQRQTIQRQNTQRQPSQRQPSHISQKQKSQPSQFAPYQINMNDQGSQLDYEEYNKYDTRNKSQMNRQMKVNNIRKQQQIQSNYHTSIIPPKQDNFPSRNTQQKYQNRQTQRMSRDTVLQQVAYEPQRRQYEPQRASELKRDSEVYGMTELQKNNNSRSRESNQTNPYHSKVEKYQNISNPILQQEEYERPNENYSKSNRSSNYKSQQPNQNYQVHRNANSQAFKQVNQQRQPALSTY